MKTWDLVWGVEAGKVDDIAFSFDGSIVATGSLETGLVQIRDTESGELLHKLETGMEHVLAVTFIGNEWNLVCGGGVVLQLWNGETGNTFRFSYLWVYISINIIPDKHSTAGYLCPSIAD